MKVLVSIEIDTEKDLKEVEAAITKGVYYGLDVRRVAPPKAVKINYCKEENNLK